MRRLKMTHYLQDPAHCSVAVAACVANYYNSEINYEIVKKIAYSKVYKKIAEEGLNSGEICLLLNKIGFHKVSLISSCFSVFDYSWEKYRKRKLLKEMEETKRV